MADRRILIGDLGSSNFGMRVSPTGIDVVSGSAASMMFDSTAANTRIIMTGSCATTYVSSNQRTQVSNVEVQLPPLDYEPIVFVNFINTVTTSVGGGVPDALAGQAFGAAWFSGRTNVNPKDYAEWTYDPATYKLKFNALSLPANLMGHSPSQLTFRYIVFSNKSS